MDSILNTIKKMLGIDAEYSAFDTDIIIHINSILDVLTQLGVGHLESFVITGPDETWAEYIGDDTRLNLIKTYIYLKVRTMFDPPSNSTVLNAMNEQIKELEWRINVTVDPE